MDENEARLEAGDNVAAQSSSTLRVNSGIITGAKTTCDHDWSRELHARRASAVAD